MYLEGHSLSQAARRLGINRKTADTHHQRALKGLARLLDSSLSEKTGSGDDGPDTGHA